MSGGSLNYGYQQLRILADEIEYELTKGRIVFNDETLSDIEADALHEEVVQLRESLIHLAERAKHLEWWLSGDYGDRTYYDNIFE